MSEQPQKVIRVSVVSPVEQDLPMEETSFKLRMPRYGVLPLTGALKDAGYETKLFCEYSGSRLDWDTIRSSDYVCFSLMSFSALRGYRMADEVRRSSKAVVIIGGAHASVEPADCLEHADYVVRNEGEGTLLDLLRTLVDGGDVAEVAGLSYRDAAGVVRHNPAREFLADIDRPVDLRWIEDYEPNRLRHLFRAALRLQFPRLAIPIVQTSRGCAYRCEFCMVKYEFGCDVRLRDPQVVVDEVERAFEVTGSRMLFIADNDFVHDEDHCLAVLEPLIEKYDGQFDLYFFACLTLARRKRLLQTLRRIRNVYAGVGIESIDDQTLTEFRKGHNETQIDDALRVLRETNINLLAFFVFSGESQTVADLRRTVDFTIAQRFFNISYCSLTDYPGREAQLGIPQMFPDHRFIHRDWRFYNGNFVLHYPRLMKPSTLQREIYEGYRRFYRANRWQPYQYKAWMATIPPYLAYLQEVERGLYDDKEELLEDKLIGRGITDLAPRLDIRVPFRHRLAERLRFYAFNLIRPAAWALTLRLAPRK
ncbi:MAG: B12-binding domain-containing radical SAM protein [Alphaproteobacteria bacterium]